MNTPTFTLTCINGKTDAYRRWEMLHGTLNQLRRALLDEACEYGWQMEGFSRLYDEMEAGTAAPASPGEVKDIAASVWDEPRKNIVLSL